MTTSRAGASLSGALAVLLASHAARGFDAGTCVQAADAGQQLRLSGSLVEAQDKLVDCTDPSCPAVVRVSCSEWLNDLRKAIPSIVLVAKDTASHCDDGTGEVRTETRDLVDVDVTLDGRLLTRKLDGRAISIDPGPHVFRFEPSDKSAPARETRIQLREGEKLREVSTVLVQGDAKALRCAPAHARTPAYVVSAVSLASLGAFAYFAGSSHSKYLQLLRTCAPDCSSQQTNPVVVEQAVADVCLGVGVLAAGVAAWLFLRPHGSHVALQPAARGASLRVSF